MDDRKLVEACLKKNREAQRELYDRFAPLMKGICMRYAPSVDEAEDILQESFIKIFRALERYQDSGPLGGWIRVITVNTAIEYYRKDRRRDAHYSSYELQLGEEHDNDILTTINLDYLLSKIQELSDGYRMVFNLYAIEGYNHREIGEMLDISEGTSKSQFSRARRILQEMIEADAIIEQKRMQHAR